MNKYFLGPFLAFLIMLINPVLNSHPAFCKDRLENIVRTAAVAGKFYPDSPDVLKGAITELLTNVPATKPDGRILAAIAPHAGYVFSGPVAACTHRQLSEVSFDTIVIIGHDSYRDVVAFTSPADYFETPLGRVQVDREMTEAMEKYNPGIRPDQSLHETEHTVEVQLPFLQVQGRQFKIVPILFGNPNAKNSSILADAIVACRADKKVFVLASTDMSHYPPYDWANKLDKSTLDALKEVDAERLFSHLTSKETLSPVPNLATAMCARGGVMTAINYARANGGNHCQILRYANSGDVPSGGKDRVVGYCSVLFEKK
ncbi:putative MEMO1 family protein AF_2310 [uncultured Desulfobacterium sp.]|uniref:Putative MEMO1 family protein AF_2310 n=1 Tax=uncultured Desulfobacterium sp. TaxID=201089 RepID=A0A445MWI0_9BACT|nr:putative MEMO1 family protein AF_2310 [uncultured Desulfobacterium sp.]